MKKILTKNFKSDKDCNIIVSKHSIIQKNVIIGPKCKKIKIGFGSFIGRDVFINAKEVLIGEYTTINHGSIIQGEKVTIGHNCWFGHYTIIDGAGICNIGNNVGVGAHSQLWSHMKFGDVLEGCKFNSSKPLIIEDDVWFVGKSISGPIVAKSKSMLLPGSFIKDNMQKNSVYMGSPARQIKFSKQFNKRNEREKLKIFKEYLDKFYHLYKIKNFKLKLINFKNFSYEDFKKKISQIDVKNRLYVPTRSKIEVKLINYLLYDKAKFVPLSIKKNKIIKIK